MAETLSPRLVQFLDSLAEALGWHRLREFLDQLRADPRRIDDPDLPDEMADILQEMRVLAPGEALAAILEELSENGESVAAHVEDRV